MRRLVLIPLVGVLLLAGCGTQVTREAMSGCMDFVTFAIVGFETPPPLEYAAALVEARQHCEDLAEADPEYFMEQYGD